MKKGILRLRTFLILWSTQSISQLGSAMTNIALTLWLYEKTGSALQMSLLNICNYTPYIIMSIFAGALSDRWDKKKTMLVCDTLAAITSVSILILLKLNVLCPIHLYILNAINGLMNTIQQPASEVATTLITSEEDYQRTSGLSSFSRSLITILHPLLATALYAIGGVEIVIYIDLATFLIAFFALLLFVKIPHMVKEEMPNQTFLFSVKEGLIYLKETPLILTLILFMAGINLIASIFDTTLPALILPRGNGGKAIFGIVSSFSGIAILLGSLLVTGLPKPKNRIRIIYLSMLFSFSTENFMLAFFNSPIMWCISQVFGWLPIPLMDANLSVILRSTIPVDMQGRVYSCRNTLQFFTIPIGSFLGGIMVNKIFEPIMANPSTPNWLHFIFGHEKGSGAALLLGILGILGSVYCIAFGRILKKYHYE